MKRLLLLGGGHAHVMLLADLAQQPLAGWAVHLVSPYRRQLYSGMLPGWIAGHYALDDCAWSLDRLASAAGVSFDETAAITLDPVANTVACANGQQLGFDLLSIDTGPVPALDGLPGSLAHALPIRPLEGFVAAWPALAGRIAAASAAAARFDLAILGGGAAGVELAFALHQRAVINAWSALHLTLIGDGDLPMAGSPQRLRRQAAGLMARRGIRWQGERRAVQVDAGTLRFEQGAALAFDTCLVATGAAAPAWPRAGGLATDERGFIRVGPSLQSVSHAHILAAGDVAALPDPRPKSGVYAVRAGPVLAANLRALCEGRAPQPWTPQRRALTLISTGNQHALASWGPWACSGHWVWRWKDHIDRAFLRRFGAGAPAAPSPAGGSGGSQPAVMPPSTE